MSSTDLLLSHRRLHRLWICWIESPLGDHRWPWRPLCWLSRHEPWTETHRRFYCLTCLADLPDLRTTSTTQENTR